MTENLDNPSLGNFSIVDTMEMGMGNAELLNDLMSPETSTANPSELKEIVKEVEDKAPEADTKPKGKEVVPNPDGKDLDGQSLISNFLGDNTEEDEEETDDAPAKPSKPTETKKEDASEESIVDSDEEGEDDDNTTQFSALAKDLLKLGVFSQDEDEEELNITTAEEFLERFEAEKKKGAIETVNNFIGQFGEDYQKAFEAIYVKGVDPKEYFGAYNNIVSFSELDLSEEDNQVKVLKQALSDQGFDSEDIETEIERLRNYGDLETVATKHHKVLVKKEAQKLQQLEEKAAYELQQKAAARNQYIQNVQSVLQDKLKAKEFDGIPINPKLANELQDFLLVDKYKTASGETLTDFDRAILELKRPENHEMKVKVGLLLKILEKDPTLSTIQKTGISKKSNELFGEVARQVSKEKKSSSSGKPGSSSIFSSL